MTTISKYLFVPILEHVCFNRGGGGGGGLISEQTVVNNENVNLPIIEISEIMIFKFGPSSYLSMGISFKNLSNP